MTVPEQGPLTISELDAIDAWWRAANYLSVGQIYLLGNPLPTEPLRPEHVKPRLFRQFSFPGGIPSHAAPETPGSIHEGGELGYSLVHAYGAAFDNPELIVACVIGDGEAETGPLAPWTR
jgi:phosphoketolase